MARLPRPEISRRVDEALALVGLSGYERRRVTELSGGEQQRVALARSLAPRPRLVMLDEPLGALDRALREQLMNDLRAILKQVGVTALYVTHDQEEAFAIADRIAILHARLEAGEGGHIEQVGAPGEVYRRPASVYVAHFLGFRNLVEGRVVGPWRGEETGKQGDKETRGQGDKGTRRRGDTRTRGGVLPLVVETPLGALVVADLGRAYAAGEPVTVLIRPEAAQICAPAAHELNVIHGRLRERSFRGSYERIQVEHASGITLTCEAAAGDQAAGQVGDALTLHLTPTAISLLVS
jgi:ABC-type Fe3+/spermidine/putrescine transport system ATPase subunit